MRMEVNQLEIEKNLDMAKSHHPGKMKLKNLQRSKIKYNLSNKFLIKEKEEEDPATMVGLAKCDSF